MALAQEIAAKDGDALRATKDGYRLSLEMTWEASIDYCLAKQDQLTMRQGGAWQEQGIGGFLEKKYKPGLAACPDEHCSASLASTPRSFLLLRLERKGG